MRRHPDEDLVDACARGHWAARRRLVERIIPVVSAEVSRVLRRTPSGVGRDRRQESQDMLQEVLVELLSKDAHELRRWQPDRGVNFDSFVRIITRRSVVRRLQRADRREASLSQATVAWLHPSPPKAEDSLAARDHLDALLDELGSDMSERDQELFERLFVEEQPSSEVAEAVGMSRDALKKWRSRMYAKVRRAAEKLEAREKLSPFARSDTKKGRGQ
ncbi:MAG: sigma-70 family RNA polymerase sigma factor [Nannocystaceae bacterium]|nr:sigma-70 family RNA polymerase sigma factor [Nannocystaceae bacterium]